jgi:hypothetical protein
MKSTDAPLQPVSLPAKGECNQDVNHAYLKHVVLKFFTCREYEVTSKKDILSPAFIFVSAIF